jgi:hypothetical protein
MWKREVEIRIFHKPYNATAKKCKIKATGEGSNLLN